MNHKTFGYIRVSTKDQNEARQLKEMLERDIPERDIFIDKESGKDFDRTNYKALKQCLRQGDLLYIKSIDRFGRNSKEIKKEWEDITQNIKADIRVIDMPLLDTTQYKDTLGSFVSELVLQVLAFVAERERENIRQRQAEGIAIAKVNGKHLGRPKATVPKEFDKVYQEWKSDKLKAIEAMRKLGLTKTTFYKLVKEFEAV